MDIIDGIICFGCGAFAALNFCGKVKLPLIHKKRKESCNKNGIVPELNSVGLKVIKGFSERTCEN